MKMLINDLEDKPYNNVFFFLELMETIEREKIHAYC